MDTIQFIITVIFVTASGALAPGPLFFATISHGSRSGARTGLVFSLAHMIVEFSLVMLFAIGLLTVANEPLVKQVIGLSGGTALLLFGGLQLNNAIKHHRGDQSPQHPKTSRLFLIGLLFTGLNPYFIIWWLTVGAQLILLSLEFASFYGLIFMYVCHVWMDFVWLRGIAYLS
ncbi:MAG: LysE family transporter, partial [Candidatus Thermoplasmatota archaeon]|nr:LysE family transporter [Candidatus Thermoplasmatota archaeon]